MKSAISLGALLALLALLPPAVAEPIHATLHKNPQCSCCEEYAAYLRHNGFEVDVKETNELEEITRIAVSMIGGMVSSTVLTLVVVPAIYLWSKVLF